MKPIDVNSDNEQLLRDTVYNYKQIVPTSSALASTFQINVGKRLKKMERRKALYKLNDYVRLSKYRTVFEKHYLPNWTCEIFRIRKVQYTTNPITYLLSDFENNEIKGSVYADELQKVKYKDEYLVEKVLRKQNGRVYIKWLGFGNEHNSWISENDML